MNFSLLLWLLLAITLFWAVGAYNRLVRLRARARETLGSLDKHLGQQAELVCRRWGVAPEPDLRAALHSVQDVPAAWALLLEAFAQLETDLRLLRQQPLDGQALQAVGRALDAVQLHWRALSTAPADLAGEAVPEDMRAEWDLLADKSRSARGGLNQVLAQHDEAIAQFPARLLARFMGFKPAGTL